MGVSPGLKLESNGFCSAEERMESELCRRCAVDW